jgi:hypothetical protein
MRRPRTTRGAVLAWAWVLLMSVAVGWVVANEAGESARLRAALAAKDEREAIARCGKWRGEAAANVLPTTSDLGRVIVRTAAASYELDPTCVTLLGQLGPVDPDAYRTADPQERDQPR